MSRNRINLVGNRYGRWTVLSRAKNTTKGHNHYWNCLCDCKDRTIKKVAGSSLLSGSSKSCGCLNIELLTERFKRYNDYDLSGDFGIGYDQKGREFYFDLEDYNKIKEHCWCVDNKDKYVCTLIEGKRFRLHNIVMGDKDGKVIDHIDGNRVDNRKENLRLVTRHQNNMNVTKVPNTKSGVIGVFQTKSMKWKACITYKYKRYNLGVYDKLEDAIRERLKKEKELFGEYSGQQHLYQKYGIEEEVMPND